jgi:hypothetical protein
MPLKSFSEVQSFLSKVVAESNLVNEMPLSPHKDFWNHLTYDQFVTGNMPNLKIPIRILVKGDSASSNLILSLKAEGPLFNRETGKPGPMPPKGPMFTSEQIEELAGWIDAGCPE